MMLEITIVYKHEHIAPLRNNNKSETDFDQSQEIQRFGCYSSDTPGFAPHHGDPARRWAQHKATLLFPASRQPQGLQTLQLASSDWPWAHWHHFRWISDRTHSQKVWESSVFGKICRLPCSFRRHKSLHSLLTSWLLEREASLACSTPRTTVNNFFFHLIKQKLPAALLFLKLIKAFLIHKLRSLRTQLLFSSNSDSDISLGHHIIRVSSGTVLTSNEEDIVKGIRAKRHQERYFD